MQSSKRFSLISAGHAYHTLVRNCTYLVSLRRKNE